MPFELSGYLPLIVILAAFLLMAVAVVLLTTRSAAREKLLQERLDGVEKTVSGELRETRELNKDAARQSREDLSGNLKGMSDSVTRVMSEMARTQQNQMDSFAARLTEIGRADENRIADMRSSVETRLRSYEDQMNRVGSILDERMAGSEKRLEQMREALSQRMESLQNENGRRLDMMRGSLDERMEALRGDNNRRLDDMQKNVDERLDKTLNQKLGESFRLVSERLEKVYAELGEMQELASGVGDLKKVLTGVKSRGLLGEIQLSALLSQLMTPEQYDHDVQLEKGGETVDFAIRLPAREGGSGLSFLPIDARFPQEAYYRLLEAIDGGDKDEIEARAQELESKLSLSAEHLCRHFILPPQTTDFAVMFLPSEGLYSEALRRPGLVEKLQREYHVTLTGPSTLAALLNSLQMGFKTLAIEKRSEEVWSLLGAVRGEFGNFAQALSRTQKRIRQASESIEDASRKSRVIERRLKSVGKLGEGARKDLLEPDAEDDDALYDGGDWD